MRGLAVFALALAACVQAAPHAIVQVPPGDEYAAGAVLVMPTTCVPDGVMPELCSPVTLTVRVRPRTTSVCRNAAIPLFAAI